ncbi:MAG: fluoride efflux transporter CrcB [Firmicutes bacterium]|nr:fluoride efflux transporter CrcB [Bacillota bacterium]
MNMLVVGLGGAVGSMLRYGISLIPYKGGVPLATLITNILGAILIGYITGMAAKKDMGQHTMLFLKTGLCGGFTTFSTFSLEAYTIFQNGNYLLGAVYILLSLLGCLAGIYVGFRLA